MRRFKLSELAEICGADLVGDGERTITGPAALDEAGPDQVSFLAHSSYGPQLAATRAGAVLVGRDLEVTREDLSLLRCDSPGSTFTKIVLAFSPEDPLPEPGVHPSAVVAPDAELGPGVHVGPGVCVGPGSVLGEGVVVEAGCQLGREVRIGAGTRVYPNVVMYPRVQVGERCILHSGTVLGADGYGFEITPQGWVKTPQCGTVLIEDDVEIGANCAVDRARFGVTRIGRGTKLDNMVHVGHNVQIGESCVIVAQVGIAGSTKVGNHVVMAGQSGLVGHIEIGDRARIGAGSRVLKSVPADEEYFGFPAVPKAETLRRFRHFGKLGELFGRVRELERRLDSMDSGSVDSGSADSGSAEGER